MAIYRVLHVLDHSLPILSGYSIRSKSIVEAQQKLGHDVQVVTGPAHQLDDPNAADTVLNGIRFSRTRLQNGVRARAITSRWPLLREISLISLLRQRILQLLDSSAVDVVHAHSPALCGVAAASAAAARRVPLVYEIRGFWEESAVDQNRLKKGSLQYHMRRKLEQFVVRHADYVVGISRSILEDLETRGVRREKLAYVPNGVDAERFYPRPANRELAAKLGLNEGEPVMGFIGSLWKFEGISWLVRAAVELHRRGTRFRLLIIGHGEEADRITKAIVEMKADRFVSFLGRIPNDEIQQYYSVMDVLVYPRTRLRLTEKVTPLKPLEAMAQAKAVLGSDVGGLRELVTTEKTGLLFHPEDIDDFCLQASRVLENEELRRSLGERARQEVIREREWNLLARQYDPVYEAARIRDGRRAR